MPAFTTSRQALDQAGALTDALDSLFGERAMVEGQRIFARKEAFEAAQSRGENVTNCREVADLASASHKREVVRIDGEIESAQVKLAHCDRYLNLQLAMMQYTISQNAILKGE